jgi:cytoskeletal protein CcmA (bactofilin family)
MQNPSVIGADLVIRGRIKKCRALDVHGYVEGGIEAEDVRIHPGGRVFGTLKADRCEVNGHLQGDVHVKNLISIGSTGTVSGSIRYGQLAMAAGGELSADVRNVPPEIHGDLQLVVRRGRSVPITLADLDGIDPDDAPEAITFTVSNAAAGFVALAANPTLPAHRFTQADLMAGQVLFVHDNSQAAAGGFDVTLTDRAGASAAPQRVAVAVVQR